MKKEIDRSAQEVLEILKRKEYKTAQKTAERLTRLYSPEFGLALLRRNPDIPYTKNDCKFFVTKETTQVATHRLVVAEKKTDLVLLNFASGKNPGGGFLKGSKSQEEDLCRCSGLYNCLAKSALNYYSYNRKNNNPLYSDYIMYSPDVPWFRKDSKEKPGKMFLASVISSPAPNAQAYLRKHPKGQPEIEKVLRQRAKIILALALRTGYINLLVEGRHTGHSNLLLGAWGCGVFGNSPAVVAGIFKELLVDGMFDKAFNTVTFAIYCRNKNDEKTFEIFKEQFGSTV